jgi:2-oxo-3-hexenedioate decarboxylase
MAYRASARLHEHRLGRGWKPLGRKIGFTNRTIWPRYDVFQPIWGHVYDRTIVRARGDRATVSLAGLAQPRVEPEICFGLKESPRAGDPSGLLGAIEWVAHSCEIVQCHHPDWKFKLADSIAVNGLHGRLVIGTPVPVAQIPDLRERLPAFEIALHRGETVVDRGKGANVLDSPLLALQHLVDLLATQPESPPLAAGEVITTGTITDAHAVTAGETWSTQVVGLPLPGLTLTFE